MSTETPSHSESSFDHFVTHWMSLVICSLGSARNSSHVQRRGSSISPAIVNVHSSSGVCGVGPADSTGKSSVTYWPPGTRAPGAAQLARPGKPRETGLIELIVSDGSEARSRCRQAVDVADGV